jgi:hypothetical protein
MTADPRDKVFLNLPYSFRRAGRGVPLQIVTRALGTLTSQLERASRAVLKAHSILEAEDPVDLERLAALYGLAPWQQEDADAFRYRVLTTARARLQGAASASSMLAMVGAAHNADLVKVVLPGHADPEDDAAVPQRNDAYMTTGFFRKRKPPNETFVAGVADMPPRYQELKVTVSGTDFELDTGSYESSESVMVDPTFDITAGAADLVLPVLVQREQGRIALVNRTVRAGERLRVDLEAGTTDGGEPGPVSNAPPVLYGTASFLEEAKVGGASLSQWLAQSPTAGAAWFLLPGKSHWRLMAAVGPGGGAPKPGVSLDDLRIFALPKGATPAELRVGWKGRRPGTFTIVYKGEKGWQTELRGDVSSIRPNPDNGEFAAVNELHDGAKQPIIDIVPGAHAVVAPVFFQRDLQRLLLVNRVIPPGSTLRVDFAALTVEDVADSVSLPGPVTMGGKPAPDLVFGTVTAGVDEPGFPALDGGPYLTVWTTSINPVPALPEAANAKPPASILDWPPLFPPGRSNWRLLAGVTQAGDVPQREQTLDLADLRIVPCRSEIGPGELRIRWQGQSEVPQRWLMEQIQALKLAGVMYVDPGATALPAE